MDDGTYHQTLAENIALLRLWSNVPEPPQENPLPISLLTNNVGKRSLKLERERDIVDNLAFISAISDDPDKVTATCIEEHADRQGMTVMLAINEGDLDIVQEGFRKMFRILEQVSGSSKQEAELSTRSFFLTIPTGRADQEDNQLRRALLMEIIELNRPRILTRLRSKHAEESYRKRGKPTISSFLADAVTIGSKTRSLPRDLTAGIAAESKIFLRSFEKLEESASSEAQSSSLLADILESAHKLSKDLRLDEFLAHLPNGPPLHPNGREALLIGMQKIGQYSSTCHFLFRAAEKLEVFKRLRVETIKPPELWATPIKRPMLLSNLTTTLKRLDRSSTKQIDHLIQGLIKDSGSSRMEEERKFDRFLNQATSESKIHAEIQILFHYEMKPLAVLPRVICSSKSACFLCDLFVKSHGKFYMARSHGRLYERWRLPNVLNLGLSIAEAEIQTAVFEKFNSEIEGRIKLILLNRRRFSHLYPSESIHMPSPAWTPSRVSTNDEIAKVPVSISTNILTSENGSKQLADRNLSSGEWRVTPGDMLINLEPPISSKPESEISIRSPENLIQGQKIRRVLQGISKDLYLIVNAVHFFFDGSILSREESPVSHILQPSEAPKRLEKHFIDIEWLLDKDAARIEATERLNAVDVNAMREGEEVTIRSTPSDESTLVYVLSSRDVIAIRYMQDI